MQFTRLRCTNMDKLIDEETILANTKQVEVVKSVLKVLELHKATKSEHANLVMRKLEEIDNSPPIAAFVARFGLVLALKKGLFDNKDDFIQKTYETSKGIQDAKKDLKDYVLNGKDDHVETVGSYSPTVELRGNYLERQRELKSKIEVVKKSEIPQGTVVPKQELKETKESVKPFSGTFLDEAYNTDHGRTAQINNITQQLADNKDVLDKIRLSPEQIHEVVHDTTEIGYILSSPDAESSEAQGIDMVSGAILTVTAVVAFARANQFANLVVFDRTVPSIVDNNQFSTKLLNISKRLKEENEAIREQTDEALSADAKVVSHSLERVLGQVITPSGAINNLKDWIQFATNVKHKRDGNPIRKALRKESNRAYYKEAKIVGDHAVDTILDYAASTMRINSDLAASLKGSRYIAEAVHRAAVSDPEAIRKNHPELFKLIDEQAPAPQTGALDKLKMAIGANQDDLLFESRILMEVIKVIEDCTDKKVVPDETNPMLLKSMSQVVYEHSGRDEVSRAEKVKLNKVAGALSEASNNLIPQADNNKRAKKVMTL